MNTTTNVQNGVIIAGSNFSSFSYRKKNQRQSNAVSPGYLLIIGAGILYGYQAYDFHGKIHNMPIFKVFGYFSKDINTFKSMFFVGGIIGCLAASFLLHKLRKAIHYYLSGFLMLMCGILYLATHDDPDGLIAGNFFGGVSFGIVFLTSLIHSSEISVKYLRGVNVFTIQNCIDTGLLLYFVIIQITVMNVNATYPRKYSALDSAQSIGVALIVISLLSLLFTMLFCIETPEFLYENGNDTEARTTMQRLRKEPMETLLIAKDLEEIESSVRMAKIEGIANILNKDDIIPFIKVLILRLGYIFSTGIPVNCILLAINQRFYTYTFASTLFMILRMIGSSIGVILIDRIGRKILLVVSFGVGGILLIIINVIFMENRIEVWEDLLGFLTDPFENFGSSTLSFIGILCMLYQIFVGLSGGCSLVIMTEAFPFINKTFLNAMFICIECLIYIITIVAMKNFSYAGYDAFIFISSIVQLSACAFTIFFITETKHKSLKETNLIFAKKNAI